MSEKTFQEQLREMRQASGLTQRAFAEQIGVPLRTLEDWLAGRRTPNNFVQRQILGK